MSLWDWFALVVLVVSVLLGVSRGLVAECLSLAAWVLAFWASQWFAPDVAPLLPLTGAAEPLRYAGAYVSVFLATLIVMSLVAWLVKKMLTAVGLRPIDRVLGAGFGLLRAGLILLAAAVVVNLTPLKSSAIWQASVSGPLLNQGLQELKPILPAQFAKYLP